MARDDVAAIERLGDDALDALARRLEPRIRRPVIDPDRLYNTQEAATYLRCEKPRIYDLIRRDDLACERDGHRILIRRRELDRHLASSRDPSLPSRI